MHPLIAPFQEQPRRPPCLWVLDHQPEPSLMSKWLPWLLGDGSTKQQHKHMHVLLGWSKAGAGKAQMSACFSLSM